MISFNSEKDQKLIKAVLNGITGISFNTINKLLRAKDVKVNGVRVGKDVSVKKGDLIEVYVKQQDLSKIYEEVYKDQNVLVVFKKDGYTSEELFTILDKDYNGVYFIHRLDRNTSGIMIFALNTIAEKELLNGFKNRTFEKKYLATVYGIPKTKQATLTDYLFKDAKLNKVYVSPINKTGYSKIITEYKVVKENENSSVLEVKLITGKTHQIRAHLAHVGHFILGDGKYGDDTINKKLGIKRQMLTCFSLKLVFENCSPLYYLDNKEFTFKGE
ncbi:MAG: RluA family pseudouridine synthase [Clostridia bacterium]|nr:RluA family pseudouridine synthase [Clostridia bacterium]